MNQKEGVFAAVVGVMGNVDGKVDPSNDQLDAIHERLFTEFKEGRVEYKGGAPDDAKLKKYIPGLVNNWLRKDTRLNGGSKYETKRPGIRAGSGDEQLKMMKLLLGQTTDPQAKADIEAAIKVRQEELKPKVEINVDAIPLELRKYLKSA